MRQELGIVNSDEELHHWLIPQKQWGSWVPNYIKNQPWNIMVMDSASEHALVDVSRKVAGVTPYSLPGRLWFGTPAGVRVIGISGGLETAYGVFEASGGDVIMNSGPADSSGFGNTMMIGKKPGQ